jgi:hypothetical protein
MPIYTFYPCNADGDANSFDAAELKSDTQAQAYALRVLTQHASCSHVVVWLGEREVMTCDRGVSMRGRPPLARQGEARAQPR